MGDCLEGIKKMPSKSVDLVMTSPPYYRKRDTDGIGLIYHAEDYIDALIEFVKVVIPKVKDTGSIVVNLGDKHKDGLMMLPHRFAIAVTDNLGLRLVNEVCWVKKNTVPQPNNRRMVSSFEPIYHFAISDKYKYRAERYTKQDVVPLKITPRKGKGYLKLINESTLTMSQKQNAMTALENCLDKMARGEIVDFRMNILGKHRIPHGGFEGGRQKELKKNGYIVTEMLGGKMLKDVLITNTGGHRGIPHHSVFPIGIPEFFIELLTDEDDVVLDPFTGSGTTLIAAKSKKRNFVGFEINPDFACLAADRVGMPLDKIIEL